MDDQRLKNPPVEGSGVPDYFDEILERIREIRASEKRMYLRVREIFALAGDYEPSRRETTEFSRPFRTGCTSPRPARQRQSRSPAAPVTPSPTWA